MKFSRVVGQDVMEYAIFSMDAQRNETPFAVEMEKREKNNKINQMTFGEYRLWFMQNQIWFFFRTENSKIENANERKEEKRKRIEMKKRK